MILDNLKAAKLTIEPYLDQQFRRPAGPSWQALFNPTQLSFTRKNRYHNTPSAGASAPDASYAGGEPDEVTIDLFFDGSGVLEQSETVAHRIDALLQFAKFQGDTHEPFYLHASWSAFQFRGVLTQAEITYTLFDRTGQPVRATVKATLQEVVAPQVRSAEERRQSPDLYQTWLVSDGDRIDLIAAKVYGDPRWWRPLAAANRLRNPRVLEVGSVLLLPPMVKG